MDERLILQAERSITKRGSIDQTDEWTACLVAAEECLAA